MNERDKRDELDRRKEPGPTEGIQRARTSMRCAMSAMIWIVLPRPISSASTPESLLLYLIIKMKIN